MLRKQPATTIPIATSPVPSQAIAHTGSQFNDSGRLAALIWRSLHACICAKAGQGRFSVQSKSNHAIKICTVLHTKSIITAAPVSWSQEVYRFLRPGNFAQFFITFFLSDAMLALVPRIEYKPRPRDYRKERPRNKKPRPAYSMVLHMANSVFSGKPLFIHLPHPVGM